MLPTFQSDILASNRYNALPVDTLQVVGFYDGNGTSTLEFECLDVNGTTAYVSLAGIAQFDEAIKTAQYALNGSRPTGNFRVSGVQANGVVDGLAFGLLWRDAQGFHIVRSNSATPTPAACYVGAWPLGGWDATRFLSKVPATIDGFARETALAVICGAKLMPNGAYSIQVL